MKFDNTQEKAGLNKYKHYQLGSNCCTMCKRDRPIKQKSLYCDTCKN